MKARPILFSAPMVRAILEGRKTQTRRVVKLPHGIWETSASGDLVPIPVGCNYGKPGDRLWVRETFCLENTYDYHGDHVDPNDGRPIQKHEDADGSYWLIPHYRATEPEPHIVPYHCDADDDKTRWTPSIFMPRWASRITLEITAVRVERLQDISEADAQAEGVHPCGNHDFDGWPKNHVIAFCKLWEAINGSGSWECNDWVWVIEFRKVEAAT